MKNISLLILLTALSTSAVWADKDHNHKSEVGEKGEMHHEKMCDHKSHTHKKMDPDQKANMHRYMQNLRDKTSEMKNLMQASKDQPITKTRKPILEKHFKLMQESMAMMTEKDQFNMTEMPVEERMKMQEAHIEVMHAMMSQMVEHYIEENRKRKHEGYMP